MIRQNLTLPQRTKDRLAEESIRQGVSMSEIVRKALDAYFIKERKK